MPDVFPRRGAIPSPRRALAAARPFVAVAEAPATFLMNPPLTTSWGNAGTDPIGDCVSAEEAFAKLCSGYSFTAQEVIAWATQHGYANGASPSDVLDTMLTQGFFRDGTIYNDGPYTSVDWESPSLVQNAISTGPVKLGVAADQINTAYNSTGGQSGWFGTGWQTDGNQDHCVSLCGYGSISWLASQLGASVPANVDGNEPGYAMYTWGTIGIVDAASMVAVTQEAWLRQPTTECVGWSPDWFPLPGEAVFNLQSQKVSAVSRASDKLDLFVIGNDSHVWTTYWNQQNGWAPDWFPTPGQAVFDLNTQQITAVSRASDKLDLFVIGNDSHVWTTYWNQQNGWAPDWFPTPGQAGFDLATQHITAVTRAPDKLDLFVIGNDGPGFTTYWNEDNGWAPDWFPVPGHIGFDTRTQRIAAVTRSPDLIDLFAIGSDGRGFTKYWNEDNGWSPDWFPVPGQTQFDPGLQHIAAVTRASDKLDLFVIGNDSHVWTTYWSQENGWSPDWFRVPGEAVFDLRAQKVKAVTRASDKLDLFVIGNDSHVWTTYWTQDNGWSADWFPLGQAVFDLNTQEVAVVSRAPGNLDLFVLGNDGRGWSDYWSGEG